MKGPPQKPRVSAETVAKALKEAEGAIGARGGEKKRRGEAKRRKAAEGERIAYKAGDPHSVIGMLCQDRYAKLDASDRNWIRRGGTLVNERGTTFSRYIGPAMAPVVRTGEEKRQRDTILPPPAEAAREDEIGLREARADALENEGRLDEARRERSTADELRKKRKLSP